jgi:hypothetical protein
MKKAFHSCAIIAVGAMAVALAAQQALAQQPAATPTKVVDAAGAADVTTITAKVEAVDVAKRLVTIKGPLGRVVTLKVDERVKNLPQVKVGDELVLKYFEAVSIALTTGGAGRSETTTTSAPVTAKAGEKPGVAMASQTKIVAKVESVDAKRQVALLQGPNGNYVEVKVKDPNVFKSVKAGDNVDVTYTEAVVVEVVAPAPAKK